MESPARLYQPNLTCKYIMTSTPDLRMRVLTVINHDEQGICDEQIVTSIWGWVKEFTKRLKDHNKDQPPRLIPSCDVVFSPDNKFTSFNIVVFCQDEQANLEDIVFALVIGNFCQHLAKQVGVNLEAMNGQDGHAPAPRGI